MIDGWHQGHELILVPGGCPSDGDLAQVVLTILKSEFRLTGADMVTIHKKTPPGEKFYKSKDRRSLIISTYPCSEIKIDGGKSTVDHNFNKVEALYYITFPYNFAAGIDVETVIAQIRLFGRMLKDNQINVKQMSLVTPIGPYDLNHSVDRKKNEGLIEGNRLKEYMEDIARAGYKEIIAICTHSPKTLEYASDNNIFFRNIDPFRAPSHVPDPRLGPFIYQTPDNRFLREDHPLQRMKLAPFYSIVLDMHKRHGDKLKFIVTDDGSYLLATELAYAVRGDKQNVLAIDKERTETGEIVIRGTKHYSTASLEDLADGIGVMLDDRMLTGTTMNKIAALIKKDYGIKELVGFIACDMAETPNVLSNCPFDKFYILETHPDTYLKQGGCVQRLPLETTAYLLAAEIFDSYVALRKTGTLPKVR